MKRKLILIGDDGAIPELVTEFKTELPNLRKLINKGIFLKVNPVVPTVTPTNWHTITTGCYVRTHKINGFSYHLPGEAYDKSYPTFNTNLLKKVETIWESAERANKRNIIINYPTAFPIRVKNSIVVGGDGLISENWNLLHPQLYKTESAKGEKGINIQFRRAKNRPNIPSSRKEPLEATISLRSELETSWSEKGWVRKADIRKELKLHYNLLIFASKNSYDTLIIDRGKDRKTLAKLKIGEWSQWIIEDGLAFRFKLLELDGSAKNFKLYRTAVSKIRGWGYPESITEEIIEEIGAYQEGFENLAATGYKLGWYDFNVYLEQIEMQVDWLSRTAEYLTKKYPWDLLFIQIHTQDSFNHGLLGFLDKGSRFYTDKKAKEVKQKFLQSYRTLDKLVGNVVKKCGDENTYVVVISDHGCCPLRYIVFRLGPLINKGLITYKKKGKYYIPDWENSKVYECYGFWVNLKGREPNGIVEQQDYEKIRDEIISALYELRNPHNGECPVAVALRREEAEKFLGYGGENVSDVVCILKPAYMFGYPGVVEGKWYHSLPDREPTKWADFLLKNHISEEIPHPGYGAHDTLPGANLAGFSNSGIFIIAGPNLTRNKKIKEVEMVDIAPTLAYLLGIPPPKNSEGKIINL